MNWGNHANEAIRNQPFSYMILKLTLFPVFFLVHSQTTTQMQRNERRPQREGQPAMTWHRLRPIVVVGVVGCS